MKHSDTGEDAPPRGWAWLVVAAAVLVRAALEHRTATKPDPEHPASHVPVSDPAEDASRPLDQLATLAGSLFAMSALVVGLLLVIRSLWAAQYDLALARIIISSTDPSRAVLTSAMDAIPVLVYFMGLAVAAAGMKSGRMWPERTLLFLAALVLIAPMLLVVYWWASPIFFGMAVWIAYIARNRRPEQHIARLLLATIPAAFFVSAYQHTLWLPIEQVEAGGKVYVGYVLSGDADSLLFLDSRRENRRLQRFPLRQVTDRFYCELVFDLSLGEPLGSKLFPQVDLPRCAEVASGP